MAGRYWKITGYEGARTAYERMVPESALNEAEVITLLQRLAARHLSDDEVFSSSLRSNTNGFTPHLQIGRNSGEKPALMTTGSGHHYTATIEEAS
jgi:hypothetical protein